MTSLGLMKYISRGVHLNSGYFVNVYWDGWFNWSDSIFIAMIGTIVIKKYRSRLKKICYYFWFMFICVYRFFNIKSYFLSNNCRTTG